jgi:hypothetical protein
MQTLAYDDMRRIIGFLPDDLIAILRGTNAVLAGGTNAILAGGFIRSRIAGEEPSDIDLFESSPMRCEALASMIKHALAQTGVRMFRTQNAHTILCPGRVPVQVIHRWCYDSPEALLQSFDFTIAQACVWFDGKEWQSLCSNDFYPDLAAKRLRYLFPKRHEDAGGSLLRATKFLRKGYGISPENLASVISRLLGGVETGAKIWQEGEIGRAKVLGGLLRKVDPLTIIAGLPSRDSLDPPVPPEPIAGDLPSDPALAARILEAFKIGPEDAPEPSF